jgi:hypothetical protein
MTRLSMVLSGLIWAAWLLLAPGRAQADEVPAAFQRVADLVESRCLECHDTATHTGGVDLETAIAGADFNSEKTAVLWQKVEKLVRLGEMPPPTEDALTADQKHVVVKWFADEYILENGREHIGPSVLRRLTRYELINTLEDLLYVSLKNPYVYSPQVSALKPSVLETLLPPDVPGESGFHNDAHQLASSKPPVLKYIDAFDFALRGFAQDPQARQLVFGFADEPATLDDAAARDILQRFLNRAWRGYKNAESEQAVLDAYSTRRKSAAPLPALLHAMKIGLLSPAFVYRMEAVKNQSVPYPVSAFELASRLSYFLWATMPDDELFGRAADNSLLDESVLLAQVDRMLKSPKRISLSEDFAGQWLGFDELRTNKAFYRNEGWNRSIYDELLFFFDELVKSDRSVLEIVDSDWVYYSGATQVKIAGAGSSFPARHGDIFAARYQRPQGRREGFYPPPKLIKINSEQRGGVITSVGILRLTSAPERTNPIRRGVWLLDKIIGQPMQPPEDIPPLAESEKVDGKPLEDLVDILQAHTSKAACVSCHKHIDPIGLGLEKFDPYGRWRETYDNKRPIQASGVFPNGGTFQNPQQMKRILLDEYREPIVRSIAQRLLAYAIGRKLAPRDRPAIDRMQLALEEDGYKMNTLIVQVITSKQFQCRQDQP